MIIDYNKMMEDYAKAYADKTRIFFIEKYLSTYNASAGRMTPFMLFPRQKVFLKSIADNPASIAIKHRQCGITTISSAWICAQIVFASKESPETVLCIGNKLDLANQLVEKIRDFLQQVPRWYWGEDYWSPDINSEKNKKDIFIKNSKSELHLFNGCKVYARSSGENAARGISAVSLLVFDEAAFIENGLAVYTSAVAATASNPNRKIIMISTPSGKDSLYYNTYRKALTHENNYNAVEFKWFQDLRYNKNLKWYKKDEKTGEIKWLIEDVLDDTGTIHYDEDKWRNLEQNGWLPTSPWYEEMKRSFNNDPMKIAQELDVSFLGSANNVVAPEFIDMHSTLNVREPLADLKDPMNDDTWFWKPPIEGHRYICACIPEGEKVLTHRGLVNVENVKSDDLLITKESEYTPIKYRKYRETKDEEIVKIKLYDIYDELTFTGNHPIWSSVDNVYQKTTKRINGVRKSKFNYIHNFKYNDASILEKNDWVEYPNYYHLNEVNETFLKDYWEVNVPKNRIKSLKFNNPLLNEDFWWYCGMWLAEGFCRYDGSHEINTVHNILETEYHNKIKNLIEDVLNRKCNIRYKEKFNSANVIFSSKEIFTFLTSNFGRYAKNKQIPEWIKLIPKRFKLKLVEGYLNGDGSIKDEREWSAHSVSLKLLNDIQDILLSCGIVSSIFQQSKEGYKYTFNKKCYKQNSYVLKMSRFNIKMFLKKLGYIDENEKIKQHKNGMYFSSDLSKIFIKIKKVEKYLYTGKVYNFETILDSHSYCSRYIVSHNCDPSRGDAGDKTAIEIIDMDGRDENGLPIIEQVLEYNGRKLGDEIGGMIFQYATMYNNAFVVIDATGGVGDTCILTLIQLGYKNLYYEDSSQKTYTVQNSTKNYDGYTDKLPGFHFQGNRYPVLANFAGMVRNNEFKIRSVRVINELDTWIFKEGTGRMDHQSGSNDDTLTCLAMALFVMQYTVNRIESTKNKDAAILNAYKINGSYSNNRYNYYNSNNSVDMRPKHNLPFYTKDNTRGNKPKNINGNFMWIFGKMYK